VSNYEFPVTSVFFQAAGAVIGLLGGAVGLLSGAVTLYDRVSRYRPYVSIYADLEGRTARAWLRVTNRAPFDIFIEKVDPEPNDLIGFALQQTAAAMADVITKKRVAAVIKPMEAAELLIVQPDKFKSERRPAEQIKIKVRWYRQHTWRRPLPATIKTSINDIEERMRAVKRAIKEPLIG
jgi:hypothetical protein